MQTPVSVSNGSFRLEIDHVPDTSDDMTDTKFTAFVDSQIIILYDAHTLQTLRGLADDVNPFFIRKESSFVNVYTDSDHNFIKHGQGPLENVQMACCKRIERSWKQCFSFHIFIKAASRQEPCPELPANCLPVKNVLSRKKLREQEAKDELPQAHGDVNGRSDPACFGRNYPTA